MRRVVFTNKSLLMVMLMKPLGATEHCERTVGGGRGWGKRS